MGQPVIVDYVPGAGGNIATERVAKAAPDGHTLLMAASGSIVINPSLYKKLTFDTIKDLAPISLACFQPNVLVVPSDLPANSVAELVALARSRPGNSHLPPQGSERLNISPASYSSPWLRSIFSTSPTGA